MNDPLPEPARYFPFAAGRYEVKPGLSRLGRDFGNGPRDAQVFQRDREAGRYLAAKQTVRGGPAHYAQHNFDGPARDAVCDFIGARLAAEHPDVDRSRVSGAADRFDALATLVQEDLCVHRVEGDRDWLAAAHLSFPNGWSAAEKVGRDFAAIHDPVPHFEPIARAAAAHARVMVESTDGLVRFAWGVAFTDDLDLSPGSAARRPPPRVEDAVVRVERQTIWGFPAVGAALFTIRTYLYPCDALAPQLKASLADAIESMSQQSRQYKGLADLADPLVRRLRHGREPSR
ncbi:MAG TPA: heme-dependent oxidative N-demethylase subunit alpha family protein [Humisphaera sp.]